MTITYTKISDTEVQITSTDPVTEVQETYIYTVAIINKAIEDINTELSQIPDRQAALVTLTAHLNAKISKLEDYLTIVENTLNA
jgi:hypothetical protein